MSMAWQEGAAGQPASPYPYYIDIVTKRYFDGVDNKRLEQVLDCFTEDAVLTEVTSNTVHEGRDAGIRAIGAVGFRDRALGLEVGEQREMQLPGPGQRLDDTRPHRRRSRAARRPACGTPS